MAQTASVDPAKRGFATLKAWRIFTKVRCCPQRVAPMAKAVLTLELDHKSGSWKRLNPPEAPRDRLSPPTIYPITDADLSVRFTLTT